jgi:hypothetical protein
MPTNVRDNPIVAVKRLVPQFLRLEAKIAKLAFESRIPTAELAKAIGMGKTPLDQAIARHVNRKTIPNPKVAAALRSDRAIRSK